jgi:hypothetical protein
VPIQYATGLLERVGWTRPVPKETKEAETPNQTATTHNTSAQR